MYTLALALVLGAGGVPGYTVVKTQRGIASVYWPGDGHSGPTCADGKPFTKERCHIAHRSWKLGSKVRVCSEKTKKCAVSFVGDRGPWGACDSKGMNRHYACKGTWSVKIRRKDPGTWRGIADLSRCVAKKIGHTGLRYVHLQLLKKKTRKKKIPLHAPRL